ncbi:hypothetical protein EVAR_40185_1 [Eumeta japonica]|uniref:Uncharacterized protein n=1 Tax=Eumeta variegata TaxID=151549 RepID=A0A4C1XN14_EUMVA|nr:hypothetical protein EVAR_40185_1 [Eumeta japonica]
MPNSPPWRSGDLLGLYLTQIGNLAFASCSGRPLVGEQSFLQISELQREAPDLSSGAVGSRGVSRDSGYSPTAVARSTCTRIPNYNCLVPRAPRQTNKQTDKRSVRSPRNPKNAVRVASPFNTPARSPSGPAPARLRNGPVATLSAYDIVTNENISPLVHLPDLRNILFVL